MQMERRCHTSNQEYGINSGRRVQLGLQGL